jgi:D-alanyl-D-alanine carboxypeptidase
LNNAGLPKKTAKLSAPPGDDIPEAMRDTPDVKRRRLSPVLLIIGLVGGGAISLLLSLSLANSPKPKPIAQSSPQPTSTDTSVSPSPQDTEEDTILGHFAYEEAPASELRPILPGSQIKLRAAAAQQFQAMVAAAQASGVVLVPISGFRSASEQQHLFFDVKKQRGQVATKRAEVSAPPGYSEHHTGYAVDIGDAQTPATNLNPNFENTAAFKWLEQNAAYYSFELSFPRNNPQGVSYEPWHWRFVGDRNSLETFYKAKNLTSPAPTPTTDASPNP